MFQRYTAETKRALYFAAQLALYEGAEVIDSTFLLRGLLTDDESRANSIFHLSQLFPEDAAKQSTLKGQRVDNECKLTIEQTARQTAFKKGSIAPNTIRMGGDGNRILAYTAREANRLRDYWIETEHLVLGILREGENAGASKLRAVGLELEASRQSVVENRGSRPPRPNQVLWWVHRRPLGLVLEIAFLLGVIVAIVLLGFGRAK